MSQRDLEAVSVDASVIVLCLLTRISGHLLTGWINMELIPNLGIAESTGSSRVRMDM
jgi:hypothetical protein